LFFVKASSCLSIELTTQNETKTTLLNDQMNILISHLCDDEDTRQVRLSIQNRYEQLMSTVDNKIQTILLEHQSNFLFRSLDSSLSSFLKIVIKQLLFCLAIETQMAFELGIIPKDLSDEYLSYDTYELALRTAIERLKC